MTKNEKLIWFGEVAQNVVGRSVLIQLNTCYDPQTEKVTLADIYRSYISQTALIANQPAIVFGDKVITAVDEDIFRIEKRVEKKITPRAITLQLDMIVPDDSDDVNAELVQLAMILLDQAGRPAVGGCVERHGDADTFMKEYY